MRHPSRFVWLAIASVLVLGTAPSTALGKSGSPVEPTAGSWKTWVLTSGGQFRLPAPPDAATTAAELDQLKAVPRDSTTLDKIAYWDVGAPGYRWDALVRDELFKHGVVNASAATSRQLSLVDIAIYDATIAAWDSKYTYNRPRPTAVDTSLISVVDTPDSPSYPSEHAAVAGAAAGVLAYLFPDDADSFASMADDAAASREAAGVQFPSDTAAGLDLGHKVADLVIERAKSDGFSDPWQGSIPTDPTLWNLDGYPQGTQPIAPNFGSLKPLVLASGNQFRPGPPPAPGSDQRAAEVAEIKNFNRTFLSNATAFFWQSTRSAWSVVAEREVFENRLDRNPPRAARVMALMNAAFFDATIACWDAKFTYWARRPFQVDPDIKPLFPTPAHPSYPSAHGCASGAQAAVLAGLFPADAAQLNGQADEAAQSRMWAGIHYRSDIDEGLKVGRQVSDAVLAWADAN